MDAQPAGAKPWHGAPPRCSLGSSRQAAPRATRRPRIALTNAAGRSLAEGRQLLPEWHRWVGGAGVGREVFPESARGRASPEDGVRYNRLLGHCK